MTMSRIIASVHGQVLVSVCVYVVSNFDDRWTSDVGSVDTDYENGYKCCAYHATGITASRHVGIRIRLSRCSSRQ